MTAHTAAVGVTATTTKPTTGFDGAQRHRTVGVQDVRGRPTARQLEGGGGAFRQDTGDSRAGDAFGMARLMSAKRGYRSQDYFVAGFRLEPGVFAHP